MVMPRRSTCDLLGPALVARVHGEDHPEARLLEAHLEACARCRREERDLRQTLRFVALAPVEPSEPLEDARGQREPWLRGAGVLAAGVVLACLFFPVRDRPAGVGGGSSGAPLSLAPAAGVATFLGEELDQRIEALEVELCRLGGSPW
ncbi:MAG: hypothetical protein HY721_32320 [Planctomycetes bacterium]|nr:hypothetical protein [Planctomycetota bacterium]